MWTDFCCLEYLFWLLLKHHGSVTKAIMSFSELVAWWVFLYYEPEQEKQNINNRALKFRFGLLVGKGLFDNSTTFIQHSQTAMNDAAENLCVVNSWDSLTEDYKNREMLHGECSADHIQICCTPDLVPLTSFEPASWQLSEHKFKGYKCSISFPPFLWPVCVLDFIFSHHLFSFTPIVSTKLNHSSFICFLSPLLAQFLPTFLFFSPFLYSHSF